MTANNKSDYTTGSLAIHFVKLMIPLIAGNILQQLYNAIDSVVISRFASDLEFASIGIASSVMNLFLFAVIGGCTGLSILFAQAYGAGDSRTFKKHHGLAAIYGSIAILLCSIMIVLFLPYLLILLNTPDALLQYAAAYLRILIGGLLVSYLYNFYASLLRAVGKAGIALFALTLAVILNLGLDILFIAYLNMGITGAAAATMIAQIFSAAFCMIYLWTHEPALIFKKEDCTWDADIAAKMLRISMVTGIHQVSLYIGKLVIQTFINHAGTDMIMACTAATRIESFANSFGDSGSSVTSVIVAQNYGAAKQERVRKTFKTSFITLAVFGIISAGILYITAHTACSFMLPAASPALTGAVSYLQTISLFYIFCFTGNTFAGYFEGIGKVRIPFTGALSHMTLRVILSYFWLPTVGLNGVATATGIGWILVNIGWTLCIIFKRKNPSESSLRKIQRDCRQFLSDCQ